MNRALVVPPGCPGLLSVAASNAADIEEINMSSTNSATPRRRKPAAPPVQAPSASKLDQLAALLRRNGGATIADMVTATGWQQHSIRGAMAGTLKKRGLCITSAKLDGIRHYSATAA